MRSRGPCRVRGVTPPHPVLFSCPERASHRNGTLAGASSIPAEDGGADGTAAAASSTENGVETLFDQIYVFPAWADDHPSSTTSNSHPDGSAAGPEEAAPLNLQPLNLQPLIQLERRLRRRRG